MAKPSKKAAWTLPQVVNPNDYICVQVRVPNERYHIAAFRGAILNLASAYNWQDDIDHTAREVALLWLDIYDQIRAINCDQSQGGISAGVDTENMIRQNPDNPCKLETSIDGVNWCEFADFSKCLPGSNQPGSGSQQPQPGGGCTTYHAKLQATGKWLIPYPVSTGDTIELSNVDGAGTDGAFSDIWFCPDGEVFFAGLCIGGQRRVSGDVASSVDHMRLIINIDGTYYDAMAGSITVPSGVSQAQAYVTTNDSDWSDNAGDYTFDVSVCNNQAANWSRDYVFSTGPSGWVAEQDNVFKPWGYYLSGAWHGQCDQHYSPDTAYYNSANIKKVFARQVTLTKVVINGQITIGSNAGGYDGLMQSFTGPGAGNLLINGQNQSGSITLQWTGSHTATELHVLCESSNGSDCSNPGSAAITSVHIEGTGALPD